MLEPIPIDFDFDSAFSPAFGSLAFDTAISPFVLKDASNVDEDQLDCSSKFGEDCIDFSSKLDEDQICVSTFDEASLDFALDKSEGQLGNTLNVDENQLDFSDPVWDVLLQSFEENVTKADHSVDDCKEPTNGAAKRCRLSTDVVIEDKTVEAKPEIPSAVPINLFSTPHFTWSMAKKNRFEAMRRLKAKRRDGRFGFAPVCKYGVRKNLAKKRKRTRKGQFARTTKFKWVSVCDLQT